SWPWWWWAGWAPSPAGFSAGSSSVPSPTSSRACASGCLWSSASSSWPSCSWSPGASTAAGSRSGGTSRSGPCEDGRWSPVLQYLLNGIATGALYSVIALGIVLVYRTSRLLNFAHGDLAMVAVFLVWSFSRPLGFPGAVAVALLAATALGAAFSFGV